MKMNRSNSLSQQTGNDRRRATSVCKIVAAVSLLTACAGVCPASPTAETPFIPSEVWSISTVPPNGDVNPYGVAIIPYNFAVGTGPLHHGGILVSNFNNSQNLQGTGTTIVQINLLGQQTLFFQGTGALGLTTALGTLNAGFVVVGNGPTADGTSGTATAGSLLVINNKGQLIQTISGPAIDYPWDMTLIDNGSTAIAFVTNALNGTVTRLNFNVGPGGLTMTGSATIASGYVHRGDPVALFVAPTGLAYDAAHDLLYVASTGDNAVYSIAHASTLSATAGMGALVYKDETNLHGVLGLSWAPNGDLLATNNDGINPSNAQPSGLVEFTTAGQFVKEIQIDPNPGGSFGVATFVGGTYSFLGAVDDNTASIFIWRLPLP